MICDLCKVYDISCYVSHPPCDISPDIWPMSPDILPIFRDFVWCSWLYTSLYTYIYIWSPWLGPVPNRWTTASVSTICARYVHNMHVRHTVNALAPRGYIACTYELWCNFHADSGIIAITRHDNVYRYTKYLVHMIRWYISIDLLLAPIKRTVRSMS